MFKQYPPITQREILEAFIRLGHRQTPEQFALTVTHRGVYSKKHATTFEDWCIANMPPDYVQAFKDFFTRIGCVAWAGRLTTWQKHRAVRYALDLLPVGTMYNDAYDTFLAWKREQAEAVPIDRSNAYDIAHIRALHKRVLRYAIVQGYECNPEALRAYGMSWYSRTTS